MISLIIPSFNNLKHLKNAYESIKKHAPEAELILIDDGSIDGTWEWITQVAEGDDKVSKIRWDKRVGHTILYDIGIREATNEIVGILHADMILGPNYIENMIKHLKPGTAVCGTRIEPPLHPPGKEKIVMDFGLDFDSLNILEFESYCQKLQKDYKDETTRGMFAPWIIYKKDFESIGGHDPIFAPFPYEDSDIFQRWILAGYELVQSRDAFVYHLTCRGHRWSEQIGKDDDFYQKASNKASRNYLRKWGTWIKNDEYQYPIVPNKYNIGYVVKNCNLQLLSILEPWCDTIYIEDEMRVLTNHYLDVEQNNTLFDLDKKIKVIGRHEQADDIIVEFDAKSINENSFQLLQQLSEIISQSGEIGEFELDPFKIRIKKLDTYQKNLVNLKDLNYASKLL